MGIKSQTNGKEFEEQFCWWLRQNGYYPEYHEKSICGSQNGDITAIKNNIAYKIECKNLDAKNGLFPLSRIECNQILAYEDFKKCNNTNMILVIRWNDNIYYIDFKLLKSYDKNINLKEITPSITNWNKFVEGLNRKDK